MVQNTDEDTEPIVQAPSSVHARKGMGVARLGLAVGFVFMEISKTTKEIDRKKYSDKQIYILLAVIVLCLAFLDTSYAMWKFEFWREFTVKIFRYGLEIFFIVILFSKILDEK